MDLRSGLTLLKVSGKQLLGQRVLDSVEKSLLLTRLNSVDAAESQTEQAIVVSVLGELSRDGRSSFNSLRSCSDAANDHFIAVHISRCARVVPVLDLPGVSRFAGAGNAWVVSGVTGGLGRRRFRGERPSAQAISTCVCCTHGGSCSTHKSAEPVSKSSMSVWPPIWTGLK